MQLPPIEVLETWPQPNYANPSEVHGPTILILTSIFIPLLLILVTLRIYTRLHLSNNFGADDVVIIAAVFPTVGCAVLALVAVLNYGWSRHTWDVPIDQLEMGLKFILALEILFVTGASLTKVSMLLLINRIMASGSNILRYMSMALMIIVCLNCLVFFIVALNTCSPVSAYWTLSFAPQNCINEAVHLLAGGVVNTLTDFCVVLVPIPVVLKLKLPLRQRIACAMLFGAGFIVCIAAGIRMAYTWRLNTGYDKTWVAYSAWIAGTIELYLGIIATCIPAIKPLVGRHFPKVLGNNFITYGQPSLQSYVRTIEPRIEMDNSVTVTSGPKNVNSDQRPLGKCHLSTMITTVAANRSKPLPLTPPMAVLSRYNTTAKLASSGAERERSHAPWEESRLSKTSLSIEVGRHSIEGSGLNTPKFLRNVESREKLVVQGLEE